MKRKFAILLSAMLLMQAVCGCGGAASSGTSSASASTGSTANKSSKKAVIVPDDFFGHVFQFGFQTQSAKNVIQNPVVDPLTKTTVHSLPRAVTLRQVSPRCTAAGELDHSVQNGAGILSRTPLFPSVFRRKQRCDAVPFFVGQFVSSQHNEHSFAFILS